MRNRQKERCQTWKNKRKLLSSSDPHQVTFYLTHVRTFHLAFYLAKYNDIPSGIVSGIHSNIQSSILSGILIGIYQTFILTFYLASILTFYMAFILTFCFSNIKQHLETRKKFPKRKPVQTFGTWRNMWTSWHGWLQWVSLTWLVLFGVDSQQHRQEPTQHSQLFHQIHDTKCQTSTKYISPNGLDGEE